MKKKLILCTICARKDSKEIKNKNFIKFLDTNLTNYTITQSKKINFFDKVVLSTDLKGSRLKRLHKVDLIISRNKKLSNDYVSKLDVIKDALFRAEKKFNKRFDIIVDLDVTSPLREIVDIKRSLKFFLKKKNISNLVTGTLAKKNPYFNQTLVKNGYAYPVIKSKVKTRQAINNIFDLNAAIYIWKRRYLLSSDTVFLDKTAFFEMPKSKSIDIDSKHDFKIVEFLLKKNAS